MTFCPKSVIYWVTLLLSIDISFTVNLMLNFRPGRFQNKILWSFIAENPKYVQTLLNISHRRFTLIYVLHWKNLNFVWPRSQISQLPTCQSQQSAGDISMTQSHNPQFYRILKAAQIIKSSTALKKNLSFNNYTFQPFLRNKKISGTL